jgi:hypothetical protein
VRGSTTLRLAASAAALAVTTALALPHAAAASPNAVVAACAQVTQWAFSPALLSFNQGGGMTVSYNGDCEYAWELFNDVSSYQVVQEAVPAQWTWQHAYFGSCVLADTTWQANLGGTGSGLLVGGTVSVALFSTPNAAESVSLEVDVLPVQNPGPCAEASATGATDGEGIYEW